MHFIFMLALVGLGFFLARRRYGYGRFAMHSGDGTPAGAAFPMDRWERKIARAQGKLERVRSRMERGCGAGAWFAPQTSGNHAFDEYRTETLRRLENEQQEFQDFLGRLRAAKDRSEFDAFMAQRRPTEPGAPQEPPHPAPPQG